MPFAAANHRCQVRGHLDGVEVGFAIELSDEPILIDGDLKRLAQVISNLLNNSAKHTPRGGHIRITARRDAGQVAVTVADDEIGIPPTMLDKVFLLFTQVDRTLEKTTGGLASGCHW